MRKIISLTTSITTSITLVTRDGNKKEFNIPQEIFQKLKHFDSFSQFNNKAQNKNKKIEISFEILSGVLLDSIKSYDQSLYNKLVDKEGMTTELFTNSLSQAIDFIFSSDAYTAPNKELMDLFPRLKNRPFRHILFALMDYFQAAELQDKIENEYYNNTFDDSIFPPTIRSIKNPSSKDLNKYTHLVRISLSGKNINEKLLMISKHPVKHLVCNLLDSRRNVEFHKDYLKPLTSLIKVLENGSLERLQLSNCNLYGLDFPKSCLRNIKTLHLEYAKNIPQSLIDALENGSLERLQLSNCNLYGLDFPKSCLRNMKTLNLRLIINTPQSLIDAFKNSAIETLDLSWCDLKSFEFPKGCLKNTKTLYLEYTKNIPQSLIDGLKNNSLERLDLSNCNLYGLKFPKGWLKNTKTLYLEYTENIPQSLIDGLKNNSLERLDLSNCDLEDLEFPKGCLRNIKTLTK